MPTIVSRKNEEQSNLQSLQQVIIDGSMGAITAPGGNGIAVIAEDLPSLIQQASDVLSSMNQTLKTMAIDLAIARSERNQLLQRVDELESTLENLVGIVDFDEALEHATLDLMDCFCSSGAADVTADGELAFDERLVLNKEDLKPMLQQAIVRWIEQRLGS